jgi:hypothetical protein
MKNKGLQLVAVNNGDSKATINRYVAQNKFSFPIVLGDQGSPSVFEKFGVEAFPTNYLLDSRGRVVYRSIGFDETGLRTALAKLGVK